MLLRAKGLVLWGPIGFSGTPLGTDLDLDINKHPLWPIQQPWLLSSALNFRRTLGVARYGVLRQRNSDAGAIWLWRY